MRTFLTSIVFFISFNLFSQNLDGLGVDDTPNLSEAESKFLNGYMTGEQRQNLDLTNKKVIFVTGNSGHKLVSKSRYFDEIKRWNEKGKIATWLVVLKEKEREYSGG